MKKFTRLFVSVCACVMLSSTAFAAIKVVSSDLQDIWKYKNSDFSSTSEYTIQTNSEWNVQQVELVAAVEIYKHGAKFCHVLVQHNWGSWKIWVSPSSCRTICLDKEHFGDTCNITNNRDSAIQCETKNLKDVLYTTSGGHYKQQDIDGFSNSKERATLLAVRSADAHGVTVSPIYFKSDSDKTNKINYQSVRNDGKLTLCAQGYKLEGGECKRNTDICRCPAGQGFESAGSDKCINCKETMISGVDNTGVCRSCNVGQIFKKDPDDHCPTAREITRETLYKCYDQKDVDEFKSCVLRN